MISNSDLEKAWFLYKTAAKVSNTMSPRKSGIFNTFISTCQQKCRNFRDFFVDYVREWNRGRKDYDNLFRLAFSPATNYNKLNFNRITNRRASRNARPIRVLITFGRLPHTGGLLQNNCEKMHSQYLRTITSRTVFHKGTINLNI